MHQLYLAEYMHECSGVYVELLIHALNMIILAVGDFLSCLTFRLIFCNMIMLD